LGDPLCRQKVYSPRYRNAWLKNLTEAGVQCRAKWLYCQLYNLQPLRRQARQELLAERRRHPAHTLLRQVPWLGPVRVALLIALIQTPHRFRTKRQFWAYSGLALETRVRGEYRVTGSGQLQCANRQPSLRGLNQKSQP
jgi:transposase